MDVARDTQIRPHFRFRLLTAAEEAAEDDDDNEGRR